jgi:hypothetical protein
MSGNAALTALLELQARLERGPKREGAFALWLFARVARDVGLGRHDAERSERRRLALLERRIAPLAVPRPLSRGLATALSHLGDGTATAARIALSQLVAPAREAIGAEAGEAMALLVRELHDAERAAPSASR